MGFTRWLRCSWDKQVLCKIEDLQGGGTPGQLSGGLYGVKTLLKCFTRCLCLSPAISFLSVHLYGKGAVAQAGGQCEISVSQVSGSQSQPVEMQSPLFALTLGPASSTTGPL